MSYKTRKNYPVKVDICKQCHKVKYCCGCKEVKMDTSKEYGEMCRKNIPDCLVLSEKELKLVKFINTSEQRVTVKVIEETLGKEYVGALGKLINGKLVEAKKDRQVDDRNKYGIKLVKYYVVKEENK